MVSSLPKPTPRFLFDGRLTVSVAETCHALGIARQTMYNQISSGCCPIPTLKVGARRLVLVADLRALLGDIPDREAAASSGNARRRSGLGG